MSLRGLKINDGVQTLPRPSRKGNLANIVAPIPVKIWPMVAKKRGRKREKNEGDYQGTYSTRLELGYACRPRWWT
jgi:hypothetical protein